MKWFSSMMDDPLKALMIGIGVLGALVLIFWPQGGFWARAHRSRGFRVRVNLEDALKHLYKAEIENRRPTLQSLAGALQISLSRAADVVERLQRRDLLTVEGEEMRLTNSGQRYAVSVIRAHRLWEQHLAEQTGVAESRWHQQAELQEHLLSPEEADALAVRLGNPIYDPHGDPIPTREGELEVRPGRPLATLAVDQWARVLHVEDEPESVFAQIRAMRFYPGTVLRLIETAPHRVRVWAHQEEHVLAPVVAANITVGPIEEESPEERVDCPLLSSLEAGERACVQRISPRCRGVERRRLLDLGILPGTPVSAEMASLGGNLTAYRLRDTLIALRREQAELIQVSEVCEGRYD